MAKRTALVIGTKGLEGIEQILMRAADAGESTVITQADHGENRRACEDDRRVMSELPEDRAMPDTNPDDQQRRHDAAGAEDAAQSAR